MHPISNRDVNFLILGFLIIIGFILYPFTIYYNSHTLHFVRNFFDIFGKFWILSIVTIISAIFCAKSMPRKAASIHITCKTVLFIFRHSNHSICGICYLLYLSWHTSVFSLFTAITILSHILVQKRMDFSTLSLFFLCYFLHLFTTSFYASLQRFRNIYR